MSPTPATRGASMGLEAIPTQPKRSMRIAAIMLPAREATIIPVTPIRGAEVSVAVTNTAPMRPPSRCHQETCRI